MSSPANPYRLSRAVTPTDYRIFMAPDLEAATFSGRVEIDVVVNESVDRLTMHAVDLDLGAALVTSAGTSVRSTALHLEQTYETATFTFDEPLPLGPAVVEIAFTGVLNDGLVGFYRSTFTDTEGTTHTIATTQFEHSDARRAFPCWDEPSFKATFQVNLTIPSHLAAFSNSPVDLDTDLGNGHRTIAFTPTMKMSTYLVAFVIGPFEHTRALDVDGVPLRIVYPLGKGHLADMALDAGAFALRFFAEYFDIAYPGDKLDMVAIPDFGFGAMENLGCITYRESALLLDPKTASLDEQRRVASIVAHEIAHMWFGDLVTMEWWEGIWLNEAFATFMEVLCTDAYRPEWKMWVSFGIERDGALRVDGLHSTRPIEFDVISPSDTQGMFDTLTYEKGGSVLRMLEQYLGAETYRDGIRQYLRTHSYANTVTTDLWDALEHVSKLPVREMMNSWILQGGHPLVTLANATLTQEPFSYLPARDDSAIGTEWTIPVMTRRLHGGAIERHLLGTAPLVIGDDEPRILNAGGSGVYRSRYGSRELVELTEHLGELDELERATLVNDSWASLFAGRATWSDFLTMAQGLGDQDEPAPWGTVLGAVATAHRALDPDQRPALGRVVRSLFQRQFERLGWDEIDGETALAAELRSTVIRALGVYGDHEEIRAEAIRRFEANDLPGNLATTILHLVAQQNRPGDYELFLERRAKAVTPQEELHYLFALADFPDEHTALDAATRALRDVRSQDAPILLGQLSRNEVTGPRIWRFIAEHWDEALAKFPPGLHYTLGLGIPTYITDEVFAQEVESFHRSHPAHGHQRRVIQQLEQMRVGLAFTHALRQQF